MIDESTAAGALALYLVGLVKGATLRELAKQFGRSTSAWGNYLNGSQVIPKPELGRLIVAYTAEGPARNAAVRRASELWSAADQERRVALAGGGLVRQHQRLEDALEQVIKYQGLAAKAEKHVAELRPMLAYSRVRLENAQLQLQHAGERERARLQDQLGLARERLGRVQEQQERARTRRLTAEEHQQFWMGEVLAAQEEIAYLEGQVQDIALPERADAPVAGDSMDDTEFLIRLEHITAEGEQDQAEFGAAPPARQETRPDDGPVPSRPVQDLSNPALDKHETSTVTTTGDDGRNHGRESSDRHENTTAPRPADAATSTPPPVLPAHSARPGLANHSGSGLRPAQPGTTVTEQAPPPTEDPAPLIRRFQDARDSAQALGMLVGCLLLVSLLTGFGTAYGAALRADPGPSAAHLLLFAGLGLLNDAFVIGGAVQRRRRTGGNGPLSLVCLGVAAQFISAVLSSLVDQPGATWLADVIGLL
ncbi:hypothetical protein [Streptomyces sp. NPDC015130]|uniref:hypothetical protein n=1 Tax=Streptomyces sp. NPDC015130 TaxID=3364940 RepID=UPI0036F7474C